MRGNRRPAGLACSSAKMEVEEVESEGVREAGTLTPASGLACSSVRTRMEGGDDVNAGERASLLVSNDEGEGGSRRRYTPASGLACSSAKVEEVEVESDRVREAGTPTPASGLACSSVGREERSW